jgi:3-isopropylmalate dehydratase small subunit
VHEEILFADILFYRNNLKFGLLDALVSKESWRRTSVQKSQSAWHMLLDLTVLSDTSPAMIMLQLLRHLTFFINNN